MEEKPAASLFVNDGSFMERFKQLQQEKGEAVVKSEKGSALDTSTPKPVVSKTSFELKPNGSRKLTPATSSSGKLAFSLKQKSKLVAPPIKLSEDDEDEETNAGNSFDGGLAKRQRLGKPDFVEQASRLQPTKHFDMAPPPPSDPHVKTVADKLASFVAKHGRQFEDVTKQKNPGDSPFRFLFDKKCADYKYYEYQLGKEEKTLSEATDTQTTRSGGGSQRSFHQRPNYQTPASALYDYDEDSRASTASNQGTSVGKLGHGESSGPAGADPIAMMEFYMKKAAQEEKKRQPKHSKDEMPPPASLQGPGKKGHHMGDYIPQEELEQFLATCNDAAAQKAAKEAAERAKIKSDNVGHKLLSKMGWKEGEGLGSSRSGIADPIMAGNVKLNNLGVGAHQPGEVTPDDDIYEQYKKRMMLGYKYRPNPLGNPRKSYY